MKRFMKELKPDKFGDIIAGVALYRPGPMDMIPAYCRNKHNPKLTTYEHPLLETILKETYGQIVYQEQVMEIFKQMGGYSLGQADMVRRAMGKKKVAEMTKQKKIFINGDKSMNITGAVANGVPKDVASNIFAKMEKFAGYAFNKSHAACYAFLAYQTAYLKYYYYSFFMASMLNNRINKWDDMTHYIAEMHIKNTKILPPDINRSGSLFAVELNINDKKNPYQPVQFGLSAVKNVGEGVVSQIIAERDKNGNYSDFIDFCRRVPGEALNKRCLESLILSGAFDNLGLYRSQLMAIYPTIVKVVSGEREAMSSGQISMFGGDFSDNVKIDVVIPKLPEYSNFDKLRYEREYVGLYLSGHPLNEYAGLFSQFSFNTDCLPKQKNDGEETLPAYPSDSSPDTDRSDSSSDSQPDTDSPPAYSSENDRSDSQSNADDTDSDNSASQPDTDQTDSPPYSPPDNYQPAADRPAARPETVLFGAIINNIKKIYTRANHDEMAILTVEDLYGTCDVMIFPKIWANVKTAVSKDTVVKISGRVSVRDGQDAIILCENIEPLSRQGSGEALSETTTAAKKLYLRFNLSDEEIKTDVMNVLSAYSGELSVVIKDIATGNTVSPKLTVRECRAIIYELNSLLSEENVVLK
jgi:DNA polymerase III alpha subunit